MPSLQIRELPPEVYAALSARAKRENRSLAQQALVELRKLPELMSRERRLKILARIKRGQRRKKLSLPPERVVRQDRNR